MYSNVLYVMYYRENLLFTTERTCRNKCLFYTQHSTIVSPLLHTSCLLNAVYYRENLCEQMPFLYSTLSTIVCSLSKDLCTALHVIYYREKFGFTHLPERIFALKEFLPYILNIIYYRILVAIYGCLLNLLYYAEVCWERVPDT